jgi:hypothetical protein
MNQAKEVEEFFKKQRRRNANPGPMVYMVAEGSQDFKPEMNKPFEIKDFQILDDYVNKNFSRREDKN